MPPAIQLDMPFQIDTTTLHACLDELSTIDTQLEALKDARRDVVEHYKTKLPMRAVQTCLAIVQKRRKLDEHPKEPMKRSHQHQLERLIERYLEGISIPAASTEREARPEAREPQQATR